MILSSKKKLGFLSGPGYMRHKGFATADTADPYFELLYLPFMEGAERPCFRDTVREHGAMPQGFVLYYTNQCPFTAKYVPVLERMATWRSLAQTSIRAELPSGKVPTTRVRRRISRLSRSITLLVRIRVQCS